LPFKRGIPYTTSMRGSDWNTFRRCLAILARLKKGPASPAELISAVLEREGGDAYSSQPTARSKAFKRDREALRDRLGVTFEYDPRAGRYNLLDAGDALSLVLSETSLMAVSLLLDTFGGQMGNHSSVNNLLEEVVASLSPEDRRRLERSESPYELELLQDIDANGIPRRVWDEVQRSVRKHRKLSFQYISPQYEDGKPVTNEVNPTRIVYQWGHWYLLAYRLSRQTADGKIDHSRRHSRYRLNYMLNNEILKVSTVILGEPPAPPMYDVRYRLMPPLSRGIVSQHFAGQTETPLPDGTLEVRGQTDNLFSAAKTFMAYGDSCEVLGGKEMLDMMQDEVRGLARVYQKFLED